MHLIPSCSAENAPRIHRGGERRSRDGFGAAAAQCAGRGPVPSAAGVEEYKGAFDARSVASFFYPNSNAHRQHWPVPLTPPTMLFMLASESCQNLDFQTETTNDWRHGAFTPACGARSRLGWSAGTFARRRSDAVLRVFGIERGRAARS